MVPVTTLHAGKRKREEKTNNEVATKLTRTGLFRLFVSKRAGVADRRYVGTERFINAEREQNAPRLAPKKMLQCTQNEVFSQKNGISLEIRNLLGFRPKPGTKIHISKGHDFPWKSCSRLQRALERVSSAPISPCGPSFCIRTGVGITQAPFEPSRGKKTSLLPLDPTSVALPTEVLDWRKTAILFLRLLPR